VPHQLSFADRDNYFCGLSPRLNLLDPVRLRFIVFMPTIAGNCARLANQRADDMPIFDMLHTASMIAHPYPPFGKGSDFSLPTRSVEPLPRLHHSQVPDNSLLDANRATGA
jgi:hypothetical protein